MEAATSELKMAVKGSFDSHQRQGPGGAGMPLDSAGVGPMGMDDHHHHDASMGGSERSKADHANDVSNPSLQTAGGAMHSEDDMRCHRPGNDMAIVEVVSDVGVDDVTGATSLVVGDVAMNSVGVTTVVGTDMTGAGVVTHVMASGSPSSVRSDLGMTELATKEVLMSGVAMQKANWDSKMEMFFVEALAEALRAGKSSPSGFRKREMEEIRLMINAKFDTNFTARQVRAKLDNLKAAWRLMSRLKGMPGFAWDEATHRFMAAGTAWVALIHQHPEFAGLQNKRAPWFPACDFIFGAIQESHKRPFTPEDMSSKTTRHKGMYGNGQHSAPAVHMHALTHPGQGPLAAASPVAMAPFPTSPSAPGAPGSPSKPDADRESFISKAVKILEKDAALSDESRLEAAEIFMQQPLVAEGFVAMGDGTRRAWLKKYAHGP